MRDNAQIENTIDPSGLVHQVCSARTLRVERLNRGVMTFKFIVQIESGERFVVRFYPPSRSHVVQFESDLLKRCEAVGMPVVSVIADSRTGPASPQAYLIYRMIDGISLADRLPAMSAGARSELGHRIVQALHELASLPVTGYGDLVAADRGLFETWRSFVSVSFAEGLNNAGANGLLPPSAIRSLEAAARNADSPPGGRTPALAWGDVSLDNVLVDRNDRLAAIIDFEGVLSAGAALNLGYSYAAYGNGGMFTLLAEAWPGGIPNGMLEEIDFLALLRGIRILRFAHRPLPTGASRESIDRLLPGFLAARKRLP